MDLQARFENPLTQVLVQMLFVDSMDLLVCHQAVQPYAYIMTVLLRGCQDAY
jgi:hypothetical protein